jgi:hypothetical protein
MTMPINRVPSSCQISVFVICLNKFPTNHYNNPFQTQKKTNLYIYIIGDQQIENNYKLLFLIFVRGPSETGTQ